MIWVSAVGFDNPRTGAFIYGYNPKVSGDCRHVAFESRHRYVDLDTDDALDVYRADLDDSFQAHDPKLVTITATGGKATAGGYAPAISDSGRYVAFISKSTDIVPGITGAYGGNGYVFLTDLQTSTIKRISEGPNGEEPLGALAPDSVVAFGGDRFVAYSSTATNLAHDVGQNVGIAEVFLYDLESNRTVLVSASSSGRLAYTSNWGPSVSEDGQTVAFLSYDPTLDDAAHVGDVANEVGAQGGVNVYVRHRHDHRTTLVSVDSEWNASTGVVGDPFNTEHPSLSADASYVVFGASDGISKANDRNDVADVYGRGSDHGNCYKYVALGDSYSSGEGTANYDLGTDSFKGNVITSHLDSYYNVDACHRSPHAYSRLGVDAWEEIGLQDILHVACSGAVMANVNQEFQYDEGRQIQWVYRNRESLQLVSLSIGGNDAGFGDVGLACATGGCPAWLDHPKAGAQCLTRRGITQNVECGKKTDVANLVPLLAQTYSNIHQEAPNAQIAVLDYPRAVTRNSQATGCGFGVCFNRVPLPGLPTIIGCSGDWTCPVLSAICGNIPGFTYKDLGLSPPTVAYSQMFEDAIDAAVKSATKLALKQWRHVDRNVSKRAIGLVEVRDAVKCHEICSRNEWINFATADGHDMFHPNSDGNASMNAALKGYLFGYRPANTCR
jgi:Tol biopolymer transport system component